MHGENRESAHGKHPSLNRTRKPFYSTLLLFCMKMSRLGADLISITTTSVQKLPLDLKIKCIEMGQLHCAVYIMFANCKTDFQAVKQVEVIR